jgi:hypothetical protein
MKRAVHLAAATASALLATELLTAVAHADRTALVVGGQLGQQEGRAVRAVALVAVEAAGWTVVESDLTPAATSQILACVSDDEGERARCVAGLFDGAKVERALVVRVANKAFGRRRYRELSGWVLRRSGKALAFQQSFCDPCARAHLEQNTQSLIAGLVRTARTRARPSLLAVRSTPAGARIRLDDKVVGMSDMDFRVYPGRHIVRLEKDGFAAATREIIVDDGEHAEIEVALEPEPSTKEPTPTTGPRPRPAPQKASASQVQVTKEPPPRAAPRSRLVPWLLVGAGGVALATGGLLLSIDQDVSQRDGLRNPDPVDSGKVAIGLGAAGALTVAAGIYLLVRRSDDPAPAPVVSLGGESAWVGVRGAF